MIRGYCLSCVCNNLYEGAGSEVEDLVGKGLL